MGKVSKPLTIVVFSPLDTWPEIVKLEKQGHTIYKFPLLDVGAQEADIIMGPRCWYMTGLHRKHLTQAIKQVRLRKYGTIAKKTKEEVNDEESDVPGTDSESGDS